MPGEDGFLLIKKVRLMTDSKINKIPAIALTAHVRAEDRTSALSAGFDMFVPKPVNIDELLKAISKLVTVNNH